MWPDENEDLAVWRLTRLPFGVNCSPFILNAVLRRHLCDEQKEAKAIEWQSLIELLKKSFYVDDCVSSLPSVKDATFLQEGSTLLLKKAGMDLRKWRANFLKCGDAIAGKVLGILWNVVEDKLEFALAEGRASPKVWTRRALLKFVARMYDPLGLLAVILTGKILLQGSWKEKSNWDAPLSDDLRISCDKWCEELRNHDTVRITRWIGCHPEQQLDLHLFTGASEKALWCCIYVCGVSTQQLIYAKTRVAPLKLQTIARLELQATFLGSKCLKFV